MKLRSIVALSRFPLALPLGIALLSAAARADHTVAGIVGGAAGPINAVPAGTMPEGMWGFSVRLEQIDLKTKSDKELLAAGAANQDVHSTSRVNVETLSAAYGVTKEFTLGVSLPHVAMHNIRSSVPGGGSIDNQGDVSGLGDVTLFGQWMISDTHAPDDPANNVQVALLGGVKLDTGDKHQTDDHGVQFETEHQTSSGSVDSTLGVAVTRSFGRASLTADLMYTHAGNGSADTNMGDVLRYDLAWGYRLTEGQLKHEHVRPDGSTQVLGTEDQEWDLALELNGFWKDEIAVKGVDDPNSGGNRVLLAPGVRLVFPQHYSLFASVGFPVIDNVHGQEHKTESRAVVGASWAF